MSRSSGRDGRISIPPTSHFLLGEKVATHEEPSRISDAENTRYNPRHCCNVHHGVPSSQSCTVSSHHGRLLHGTILASSGPTPRTTGQERLSQLWQEHAHSSSNENVAMSGASVLVPPLDSATAGAAIPSTQQQTMVKMNDSGGATLLSHSMRLPPVQVKYPVVVPRHASTEQQQQSCFGDCLLNKDDQQNQRIIALASSREGSPISQAKQLFPAQDSHHLQKNTMAAQTMQQIVPTKDTSYSCSHRAQGGISRKDKTLEEERDLAGKYLMYHFNNVAEHLDNNDDTLPRPFHPAIGRPLTIVPCSGPVIEKDIKQVVQNIGHEAPPGKLAVHLSSSETSQGGELEQRKWPALRRCHAWRGTTDSPPNRNESTHALSHVVSSTCTDRHGDTSSSQGCAVLQSRNPTLSTIAFSGRRENDTMVYCRAPSIDPSFVIGPTRKPLAHGNQDIAPMPDSGLGVTGEGFPYNLDSKSEDSQHYQVDVQKVSRASLPIVKPLNAYNYFYAEIRDGILTLSDADQEKLLPSNTQHGEQNHNICRNGSPYQAGLLANTILLSQDARFSAEERKRWLLSKHWNKDRNTRRKHRTRHGKISFQQINKLVSTEWSSLSQDQKAFYKDVANTDKRRYQAQK